MIYLVLFNNTEGTDTHKPITNIYKKFSNGYNLSQDILQKGIEITLDYLPDVPSMEGKIYQRYINPSNGDLSYEYIDAPTVVSPEQERITTLEEKLELQNQVIDQLLFE